MPPTPMPVTGFGLTPGEDEAGGWVVKEGWKGERAQILNPLPARRNVASSWAQISWAVPFLQPCGQNIF